MLKKSPYISSLLLLAIVITLMGCAGYQRGMQRYDGLMAKGNYKQAYNALEHFKFLQKSRNQFLYYAEKGRIAQLMNQFDTSNYFLNLADAILENTWKNAGDALTGNLINPMQERYLAEDMERMMLHYCKAMNYLALGDKPGALVEARRITLQANRLIDTKTKGSRNALSFGYWVQGFIYEANNDLNNAFIAYRNAVEQWASDNQEGSTYGKAPEEMLADVIRTAAQLGFSDQVNRFAAFAAKQPATEVSGGGSLLILHESGRAPVLQNSFFSFNSWAPGGNNIYFSDPNNRYQVPVQSTAFSGYSSNLSPGFFKGLRVAVAVPQQVNNPSFQGSIQQGAATYSFYKIQDMFQWATRPEAMSREVQKAVLRALVKKGTEIAAQEGARAIAKSADKSDKKEDDADKKEAEKKKDAQAAAIAQGVGLLVNILNQSTEVADTRSWRSLPGAVYTVRIPLRPGTNTLTFQQGNQNKTITVEGNGGMQVMRW